MGELNIAGLPAVTTPAGYYVSGAPFEIIFLGKLWGKLWGKQWDGLLLT